MTRDYDDDDLERGAAGQPRTSGKAIASLLLGIASLLCTLFTAIPGVIFAILALTEISQSGGRRTGRGLAITGLIFSILGIAITPILLVMALLFPAVSKVREAANRMQSSNNLKQIGVGMHNYASAGQDRFPPAVVYDKDNRPLYSSRVLLLPYVEEDILFKQFHFDEPWDSPHNVTFLQRMPKVYRHPTDEQANAAGNTYYQVFNGPGAIFHSDPKRGVRPFNVLGREELRVGAFDMQRIGAIPDGTSNTFLVAEAAQPVPWTKPDDIPFDPALPLPKLGGRFSGVYNVLFADGSVRSIRTNTPEETLKIYIRKDDGLIPPELP